MCVGKGIEMKRTAGGGGSCGTVRLTGGNGKSEREEKVY